MGLRLGSGILGGRMIRQVVSYYSTSGGVVLLSSITLASSCAIKIWLSFEALFWDKYF